MTTESRRGTSRCRLPRQGLRNSFALCADLYRNDLIKDSWTRKCRAAQIFLENAGASRWCRVRRGRMQLVVSTGSLPGEFFNDRQQVDKGIYLAVLLVWAADMNGGQTQLTAGQDMIQVFGHE